MRTFSFPQLIETPRGKNTTCEEPLESIFGLSRVSMPLWWVCLLVNSRPVVLQLKKLKMLLKMNAPEGIHWKNILHLIKHSWLSKPPTHKIKVVFGSCKSPVNNWAVVGKVNEVQMLFEKKRGLSLLLLSLYAWDICHSKEGELGEQHRGCQCKWQTGDQDGMGEAQECLCP